MLQGWKSAKLVPPLHVEYKDIVVGAAVLGNYPSEALVTYSFSANTTSPRPARQAPWTIYESRRQDINGE